MIKRMRIGTMVRLGGIAAVIIALFAGILFFGGIVEVNRSWVRDVEVPTASKLAETVFESVRRGGAIWPVRAENSVSIAHTPCSTLSLQAPEMGRLLNGRAGEGGKRYVRELCETAEGKRIRSAIAAFNRAMHLVGIRDNRFATDFETVQQLTCSNGEAASVVFVPHGCLGADWTISLDQSARALREVSVGNIPIDEYVFLASYDRPFFGDWSVAAPTMNAAVGPSEPLRFETPMAFPQGTMALDVIGVPLRIEIDGQILALAPEPEQELSIPFGGGQVAVQVQVRCADPTNRGAPHSLCTAQDARGRPIGARIVMSVPEAFEGTLAVIVQPMLVVPQRLRQQSGEESRTIGLGALQMNCQADGWPVPAGAGAARGEVATGCKLIWDPVEGTDPVARDERVFQLTAGQVDLLDPNGSLSSDAYELGLADLVGLGTSDPGALARVLATEAEEDRLSLTLSPRIQRHALAAIDGANACAGAPNCRTDLVVLRVDGAGAGEVLGMAGRPTLRPGLSWWDILALERASPSRSPLAGHGWRAHGLRATPGSSYKLVTALAAAQAVLDNPDSELQQILLGRAEPSTLISRLGLARGTPPPGGSWPPGKCVPVDSADPSKVNARPVPTHDGSDVSRCLKNFGAAPSLGSNYVSGTVSGCHPGDRTPRLGICEALMKSSNLFFSGLSLALDEAAMLENGKERTEALPDLLMAQTASRLFGLPPENSTSAAPEASLLDALSMGYSWARRLRADPVALAAARQTRDGAPRRLQLAQAGIGQSVTATPLAMASVAASIARAEIVRPHLFGNAVRANSFDPIEGTPILLTTPANAALAGELLDHVKAGMKAVVAAGTARGKFVRPADLRPYVFAKTGTADLFEGQHNNAAWLVGYADTPGGNSGIAERIAFACRVAAVDGGGGSVCAPIVNAFLQALHADTVP